MKTEKFSISFILIMQALLMLLLFVSQGYVKYATLALFCFFDIVILFSLFRKKWQDAEWFTFTTLFCSLLFLMLYIFAYNLLTLTLGIAIVILFIIASLISKQERCCARIMQETLDKPDYPMYHEEHKDRIYDLEELENDLGKEIYKDVEKKAGKLKKEYDARVADALQYELEREAFALEKAQKYTDRTKNFSKQEELEKEALALEKMQEQINALSKTDKKAKQKKTIRSSDFKELQKEAKELQLAEDELEELDSLNKKYELMKEAGKLRKAEKQIEEVQRLNKKQELISEARKIAQAQKEFDIVAKALKAKKAKKVSKSFFVAKEGTSTYHKPNCRMIANVPKNKLNLFTSKKDASKKRLKPCKSCKP